MLAIGISDRVFPLGFAQNCKFEFLMVCCSWYAHALHLMVTRERSRLSESRRVLLLPTARSLLTSASP